jgi:hypothetical protein
MSKEDKDKLAKGAAAIKKEAAAVEAKAKAAEPLVIPKSTRDIKEIVQERVTVLPGSIGVKLADDTPLEEVLRIMDWATTMSDHVGFMIGDIINFGSVKWGDKYRQAMEQTGRAYSTLAGYAETARRFPAAKRQANLSFTHHREIMRLNDDEKIAKVLKEVSEGAEKDGKAISTKIIREKVMKLTPRKVKKPKKITSGKGKKGGKKKELPPPYKPTEAEQAKLDEAEIALEESSKMIKAGMYQLVSKLDNKEKLRWLKLTEPFVTFYNLVDKYRGY